MNDIPIEELPLEQTWGPEPDLPLTPAQQKELDEVRLEHEQIEAGTLPF